MACLLDPRTKLLTFGVTVLLLRALICTALPVNEIQQAASLYSLNWETYSLDTGQVEVERVSVDLPSDLYNQPNLLKHYPSRHRHLLRRRSKRVVFGDDDRVRIDPASDGKKFPYSTIMRVSTGCSGIMVSKKHVLTAAHCVHDGLNYRPQALFLLRAGYVTDGGKTKWFYVRRFFIPSQWKNLTESNRHVLADWDDYDVAVLEMATEDMSDERDFIPPGLSGIFCAMTKSVHGAGSKIEFVSFPDDKSIDALWYVQTRIETESPHLIYFRGDAWHGSSGAGIYTWDYNEESGKYERRVIGVLSGNRNTEAITKIQGNFNVAARLNPVNFMLVCHWIGSADSCKQRYIKYLSNLDSFCKPYM